MIWPRARTHIAAIVISIAAFARFEPQAGFEPSPSVTMVNPRSQRVLLGALTASLLFHVALVKTLSRIETSGRDDDRDELLLTDIDVPPEPPEAHQPEADDSEPAPEPETELEPTATIEPAPEPEPEPEPEPIAELAPDAGVDAAVIAEPVVDAAVEDATRVAEAGDAGADGGTMVAEQGDAGTGDGGVMVAEQGDAGTGDGGVAVAVMTGDGGVTSLGDGGVAVAAMTGDGVSGEGSTGPPPPPGAEANLLSYFPPGEVITVLIRLDRFRDTQWAEPMQAILGPMPDYQAIVGTRQISMADLFDTLVISSPRPEDVTATTLVARYRQSAAYLRGFLDHGEARTKWRAVRGGALGVRQPSSLIARRDRRVFLMPFPGVIVLCHPRHLGPLTQTARRSLARARAREQDLPEWLRRVRTIEAESGEQDGPALLLTMQGFPRQLEVPVVGSFPGPDRATLAFEITRGGFLVRGNLLFDTEARAAAFQRFVTAKQKSLLSSYKGRLLLAPFSAVNAVEGLSLKRKGNKVAYATSISIADGRAMLEFGARWSQAYFTVGPGAPTAAPPKATPPRPAPPRPAPSPGGGR